MTQAVISHAQAIYDMQIMKHDAKFRYLGLEYTSRPVVDSFHHKNVAYIPANFAALHLGFFCKEELKIERARVPVKLRLDGLQYCNWLEQKPGYKTAEPLYNY